MVLVPSGGAPDRTAVYFFLLNNSNCLGVRWLGSSQPSSLTPERFNVIGASTLRGLPADIGGVFTSVWACSESALGLLWECLGVLWGSCGGTLGERLETWWGFVGNLNLPYTFGI